MAGRMTIGRALRFTGWALLALILLSAALLGVALVLLTGQTGRDLVENLADGREAGRYGVIDVSGLSGDPLSDLSVAKLTLSDADGVWLEIEDARLVWTPGALIGRRLEIERLEAGSVSVFRRPAPAGSSEAGVGGGPGLGVSVAALDFPSITLAEPVLGEAMRYSASGALDHGGGETALSTRIERIDRPGDRLVLDARLADQITLDGELAAEPGGAIAALLRLEQSRLSARIDASGTLDEGEGAFSMQIDAAEFASGRLSWTNGAAQGAAELQPAAHPAVAGAAPWLDGAYDVTLTGPQLFSRRTQDRFADAELTAEGAAGSFQLRFADARNGAVRLQLDPSAAQSLSGGAMSLNRLLLAGDISIAEAPAFDGRLQAEDVDAAQVRVASLNAALRASLRGDVVDVTLDAQAAGLRHPVLEGRAGAILGDAPQLRFNGRYERGDRRIVADEAVLETDVGAVSASGRYRLDTRRIEADVSAQALPLADLQAGLSGEADLSAAIGGALDGALRFDARGQARGLSELAGDRVDVAANGVYEAGAVTLETFEAASDRFTLDGAGAYGAEEWRVAGTGAWTGRAPVSAVTLSGAMDAGFELRGAGPALTEARIELTAPGLAAGPVELSDPRLRVSLDDTGDGAWRLDGGGPGGPVDVGGALARTQTGLRLDEIDGRFGPAALSGAVTAEPEAVVIDLEAAPLTGFGEAAVSGRLSPGALSLSVVAADFVTGDGAALDRLEASLSGTPSNPAVQISADGVWHGPFRIEAEGAFDADAGAGELALSGRHRGVDFATERPIRYDGPSGASGALRVGDGVIRIEAARDVISVSAEDAPAALISNLLGGAPLEGRMSAQAALNRSGGVWTGEGEASLRQLKPAEIDDADALDLGARFTLDEAGWRFDADAQAAGLSADARLNVETGPVGALGAAFPGAAGIQGRIEGRGQVDTLAAFRLPETLQLSGRVRVRADVAGTLGDPVVEGAALLNSGRLIDQQTGLDLRVIDARAELAGDTLRITRLTAQDGRGGRFTGSGEASWSADLLAEFDGEFQNFRLINHPDRTAIGGGTVSARVQDGALRVGGDIRLDRAEIRPPEAGRAPIPELDVTEVNAPRSARPVDSGGGLTPQLDLRVDAPARIFVRGPQFDTEWGLDLRVSGRSNDLSLRGDATLQRGRASLIGQNFTIERGVIRFAGPVEDARLDILAVRETADITARVSVTGRVAEPEFSLSSRPSLPEDEIASRLLFNRGAGSLSGVEAAQLAAALASLSGGFDPFAAVRSATGLDQFAFASDAQGETVVTGGRYLTEDVYLEVATPTAGGAPRTSIEWSLTRRLSVRSSVTTTGDAAVSLSWRREYD